MTRFALLLLLAGCASPPCRAPEALSPYSGVCAVEGTDMWFGCTDDCQAPAAPPAPTPTAWRT